MADTKEILEEVRDLGWRLAGINTDLPLDEAITELQSCDRNLRSVIEVLVQEHAREYDLVAWLRENCGSPDAEPS